MFTHEIDLPRITAVERVEDSGTYDVRSEPGKKRTGPICRQGGVLRAYTPVHLGSVGVALVHGGENHSKLPFDILSSTLRPLCNMRYKLVRMLTVEADARNIASTPVCFLKAFVCSRTAHGAMLVSVRWS